MTSSVSMPRCEAVQGQRTAWIEKQPFFQLINSVDFGVVGILDQAPQVLEMGPLGPVKLTRHDDNMVRQELLEVIAWIAPRDPLLAASFDVIRLFLKQKRVFHRRPCL